VDNYLHIIFSTKERLPLIPKEMENRLYGYLGGIARKRESPILKINGMADHLHILLKLHPSVSLSTLVKELKSYSTGWMKKEAVADFGWQVGYGGFSCSPNRLSGINKYIDNQKEHHKTLSFKDEIEIMRQRFGIKWVLD
jgi:REP element-mobilizing transposase RayT